MTDARWIEVTCAVNAEEVEAYSAWLTGLGALSVRCEANQSAPLFREGLDESTVWAASKVIGLFDVAVDSDAIVAELVSVFGQGSRDKIKITDLADQDWVRLTQAQFSPQLVSERLWVSPTGQEVNDGRLELRIDPGLAFGTGTHATTRLCLQWLCEHDINARSILDYGCGSGILAIGALLLGAESATAIDHDEQALLATRSNAALNDLLPGSLQVDYPAACPAGLYDVIVANILAKPLLGLVDDFATRLGPQGSLVLSGLLVSDADTIRVAYQSAFIECECVELDGWLRMVWRRSS